MNDSTRSASRELLINTVVFGIGTVGAKIVMFFLLPIYTNYLSAAELGTAELVVNLMNLLYPVATINILSALLRFAMDKTKEKKDVLGISLLIVIIGCIITSIILQIIRIESSVQNWKTYLCILLIVYSINQTLSVFAKGTDKTKICAIGGILYTLFLLVCNIALLIMLHRGTAGYLEAIIIANCLTILFYTITLKIWRFIGLRRIDWYLVKDMVLFSVPLIVNSISWWLTSFCDRFVLEYYIGADAVGIYSVSSKIPMLISTIAAIFMQAWVLSAIKEYERNIKTDLYDKVFEQFSSMFFVWAALIICVCRLLVAVLVGTEFSSSWIYVPILLCAAVFSGFGNFYSALYTSAKKNTSVMLTTLAGAAVNIALNFILIPKYAIHGAVVATMISQLVVMIYRMVDSRKFIQINYNPYKFFTIIVLLIIECAVLVLYDSLIGSVCAAVIILGMNFKEMKSFSMSLAIQLKSIIRKS